MMDYNLLNMNRSIEEYGPMRIIGKYITCHAESIRAGARIGLVALVTALAGFYVGGCGTLVVAIGARLRQAISKDTESTIISAENRGLPGYIIDYELIKERQIRVNKKYNELMQMIDEEEIKREIDRFGDYEFGDKVGRPGGVEIDKAYQAFLERWKSEPYKRNLRNRPFIQILEKHKSLLR